MTRRPARAAFTMVELLIVIVIIALLAGLLLAGIARVRKYATVTQATNDITQLEAACTAFKTEYQFVPPSSFTVPTRPTDPGFQVLKKMYTRWSPALDGSGNITPPLTYAGQTLNGNQSMVYFLGGPNNNGWMVDAPYDAAAATTKKGPYFDFKPDRLVPGTSVGYASAAPVFLDPFKNPPTAPNGSPFAYFGSTEGGKYQANVGFAWNGVTVYPFVEQVSGTTITKFVNQGTVQIVSAGEDGVFGPGCPGPLSTPALPVQCRYVAGQSAPTGGISPYGEGDAGADDLGNVNSGGNKLGVGR